MSGPYAKPQPRKGMVCHFVAWNRDGSIKEARYRPAKEAKAEAEVASDEPHPSTRRRQGKLI